MRTLMVRSVILRGVAALLVAGVLASLYPLAVALKSVVVDAGSNPPLRLAEWIRFPLVAFVFLVVALSTWLLPALIAVQWVMTRRQVRGPAKECAIGLIVSLVACATLMLGHVFESEPVHFSTSFIGPVAAVAIPFVIAWFVLYGRLSSVAPAKDVDSPLVAPIQRSAASRAARTAIETLAVAAAFASAAALGTVAGVFDSARAGDGADQRYRLVGSVLSPHKETRAVVVHEESGGENFTRGSLNVYLLPASQPWSEGKRGLLVWDADDVVEDVDVHWEGARSILVSAAVDSGLPLEQVARAYSREGVHVRFQVTRRISPRLLR